MENKEKEFGKFKEFKDLAENIFENNIKTLRSNNGGEFTSNEFKDFYKEAKNNMDLTTPYNRQKNGVAVRKNRSIMEVVKIHDP